MRQIRCLVLPKLEQVLPWLVYKLSGIRMNCGFAESDLEWWSTKQLQKRYREWIYNIIADRVQSEFQSNPYWPKYSVFIFILIDISEERNLIASFENTRYREIVTVFVYNSVQIKAKNCWHLQLLYFKTVFGIVRRLKQFASEKKSNLFFPLQKW